MSQNSQETPYISEVSKSRLKTLVIPKKRKLNTESEVQVTKVIKPIQPEEKGFECPFCAELIPKPYPTKIDKLIKKIKKNEKEYEKEMRQKHGEEGKSGPFVFIPAGLSENDKKLFCRMHRIELEFKPMAVKKQYPAVIEFEAIHDRIVGFEKDLVAIVDRKQKSQYLDNAVQRFEELGVKARNSSEVIKVFRDFLPGYYGNRGLSFIMDSLNRLFLQSKILSKENSKPLSPVEFIQQVLVPECGIRLIQQDRDYKITLEEAKVIMKESEEYGSVVYFKSKKSSKDSTEQAKDSQEASSSQE